MHVHVPECTLSTFRHAPAGMSYWDQLLCPNWYEWDYLDADVRNTCVSSPGKQGLSQDVGFSTPMWTNPIAGSLLLITSGTPGKRERPYYNIHWTHLVSPPSQVQWQIFEWHPNASTKQTWTTPNHDALEVSINWPSLWRLTHLLKLYIGM